MGQFGDQIKPGTGEKYAPWAWTPSGPGDHTEFFIRVNGTTLTTQWVPIRLEIQFNDPCQFDFFIDEDWDQPSLDPNDEVEFIQGSRTIFRGRIIKPEQTGYAGREGVIYHCLDNVFLLDTIAFKKNRSLAMVYNSQPGEPEYGIYDRNKTCGQIIRDILDAVSLNLVGIISGYTLLEFSGMDITPPRIELVGKTIREAIQEVLNYQFNYAYWIDPTDLSLHFQSIRKVDLTTRNIDFNSGLIEGLRITPDVSPCITQVIIQGRRETELVDYINFEVGTSNPQSGSSLLRGWNPTYEAAWSAQNSEDDPDREDYGKVYRFYQLSHQNLLPNLIYVQSGITIMEFDPTTGAVGNWKNIGGKVNLRSGLLKLTSPSWKPNGSNYLPKDLRIRYAYLDNGNIPEISIGHSGSAYTSYGWKRALPLYDPEFKVQTISGIITAVGSGKIYDATGQFTDDVVGKTLNGQIITAASDGWITVSGTYAVGDSYTIDFRDDTPSSQGMYKIAQAIVDMLSDVQYIGEIKLDGLDFTNYQLGQKINVINTSDSNFSSMDAPLRKIVYDFQNYATTVGISSGYYFSQALNYDELKRRLTNLKSKSRVSAWVDINAAGGGGDGGASSPTRPQTHKHSGPNDGGDILVPNHMYVGAEDAQNLLADVSGVIVFPYSFNVVARRPSVSDITYKPSSSQNLFARAR